MSNALRVSPLAARRFLLRSLGLDNPFASLSAALDHLGYVQIDPINVCGRMHDLILRNRVLAYHEGALMRHLHGGDTTAAAALDESPTPRVRASPLPAAKRTAFEHHHPDTHILAAFPLDAWPHLLAAMHQRSRRTSAWSGRLTPRERELVPELLAEIRRRGPLNSDDFADARRAHRIVWGRSSLVKSVLQKLFFHGRLLIAQRLGNRRSYDLPERVLPAEVLGQSAPTAHETARWIALLKLRQRRLVTLKRKELTIAGDAVQAVGIDGCPPLFCLKTDVAALLSAADSPPAASRESPHAVRLLAPLDPLIYDRRVTAALWDFDYTWEAYTPPAKRVRGHYALPVLVGTELVGHVEPKADRTRQQLRVMSRSVRRGYKTAEAVAELGRWLTLGR